MGIKYLWDTNIAIYYLQQQFPIEVERYIDGLLQDGEPAISVITEIELLCWKTDSEKDLAILKSFIKDSIIIDLEPSIKLKTADLRKKYKIKLPDAIIAATAIENKLILVTRNVSDFANINGLKLIDPFNL